ncbi:MAG TPA: hypothetical protein VN862_10380 [Candidatus Acidoferrales bacterium]|nr:hypothetical protein [Candidatus Acidoferrales bacterium]
MAFLRRKGNAYYLVHNVREGGKIKQLHLARLGERPRITDDVMRQVNRTHPTLALDWRKLREQVNNRAEIPDAGSAHVQKLLTTLRTLNLDLADLFPPVLNLSQTRGVASEIITQLRLLHSTVGTKLDQFNEAHFRIRPGRRSFR